MHLSGVAVRTDQVQLLVGLLNADELAAKLKLASKNGNDLVALSRPDREPIGDGTPRPAPPRPPAPARPGRGPLPFCPPRPLPVLPSFGVSSSSNSSRHKPARRERHEA